MSEEKMQASNISEDGQVLFLDEERLARKEVGFPPYKNKPNGLGIYNWLKVSVSVDDANVLPGLIRLFLIPGRASSDFVRAAVEDSYSRLLFPRR